MFYLKFADGHMLTSVLYFSRNAPMMALALLIFLIFSHGLDFPVITY
jgi:hypothetical protein